MSIFNKNKQVRQLPYTVAVTVKTADNQPIIDASVKIHSDFQNKEFQGVNQNEHGFYTISIPGDFIKGWGANLIVSHSKFKDYNVRFVLSPENQNRPDAILTKNIPNYTIDQLRSLRAAIGTMKMNLPYGPRPNQDDNVFFGPAYPIYDYNDRMRIIAKLEEHNYTHLIIGPIFEPVYGTYYPWFPILADANRYCDILEELYENGIIPVYAICPLNDEFRTNGKLDFDIIRQRMNPVYQSSRFQELVKVSFLAWEPSDGFLVDDSKEWVELANWCQEVFPQALRYLHTRVGQGAPGSHKDIEQRGMTEGTIWGAVAPLIHGWFCQFGPDMDINNFSNDVADLARRFPTGYAGWPTYSCYGPNIPLDFIAFEYKSYNVFRANSSEDEAIAFGKAAMQRDYVRGFGDGG
jgi:hypothetical protein